MKLSYDDDSEESVGSLNFNNSDSLQSSGSMPLEERNEDPNIILEVRREAVGSSSGEERSTITMVPWSMRDSVLLFAKSIMSLTRTCSQPTTRVGTSQVPERSLYTSLCTNVTFYKVGSFILILVDLFARRRYCHYIARRTIHLVTSLVLRPILRSRLSCGKFFTRDSKRLCTFELHKE